MRSSHTIPRQARAHTVPNLQTTHPSNGFTTVTHVHRLLGLPSRAFIHQLAGHLSGAAEVSTMIAARERGLWYAYDPDLPRPDMSMDLSIQDIRAGAFKGLRRNVRPVLQQRYGVSSKTP